MKKTVREHLHRFLWARTAWISRRLRSFARSLELAADLHEEGPALSQSSDPLVDMLHRALGTRTGRLRVSDAYLLCGIEPGEANQDQINRFGKAIRALGWERQRRRFDGVLQYAFVKGTEAEREVEIVVEYEPHMHGLAALPRDPVRHH